MHTGILQQVNFAYKDYIVVPKKLILQAPQLSIDSNGVLAYCILRSRATLSEKSNWKDDVGIYVRCTSASMAEMLGCSKQTAASAIKAIAKAGLITVKADKKKPGQMKTTMRIYPRQWTGLHILLSAQQVADGILPHLNEINVNTPCDEEYSILPRKVILNYSVSARAKLLYSLLLDQLELVTKYHEDAWSCHIPSERSMEMLHCSKNTLTATYVQLEEAGLIQCAIEKYTSKRTVSIVDIYKLATTPKGDCKQAPEQRDLGNPKKENTQSQKEADPIPKDSKTQSQKITPSSLSPLSSFSSISSGDSLTAPSADGRDADREEKILLDKTTMLDKPAYDAICQEIKAQIGYTVLCSGAHASMLGERWQKALDLVVEIMADTRIAPRKSLQIHKGRDVALETAYVVSKHKELRRGAIDQILYRTIVGARKPQNLRRYLQAALVSVQYVDEADIA